MNVSVLPDWVEWLAQDADGAVWGYEAEPNKQHNGWYENEVGRIVRLEPEAPPPPTGRRPWCGGRADYLIQFPLETAVIS